MTLKVQRQHTSMADLAWFQSKYTVRKLGNSSFCLRSCYISCGWSHPKNDTKGLWWVERKDPGSRRPVCLWDGNSGRNLLVKESTLSSVCLCVCCSQLHGDLTAGFIMRASTDKDGWSPPTQFGDFANHQTGSRENDVCSMTLFLKDLFYHYYFSFCVWVWMCAGESKCLWGQKRVWDPLELTL